MPQSVTVSVPVTLPSPLPVAHAVPSSAHAAASTNTMFPLRDEPTGDDLIRTIHHRGLPRCNRALRLLELGEEAIRRRCHTCASRRVPVANANARVERLSRRV